MAQFVRRTPAREKVLKKTVRRKCRPAGPSSVLGGAGAVARLQETPMRFMFIIKAAGRRRPDARPHGRPCHAMAEREGEGPGGMISDGGLMPRDNRRGGAGQEGASSSSPTGRSRRPRR